MTRIIPGTTLLAVAMAVLGCSNEPKLLEVTGAVTYAGQPVKSGSIRFESTATGKYSTEGFIADGRYKVKIKPGNFRVEVSSPRPKVAPGGKTPPGPGEDEVVETIPAKYNTNSELKVEIGVGQLSHDFTLTKS